MSPSEYANNCIHPPGIGAARTPRMRSVQAPPIGPKEGKSSNMKAFEAVLLFVAVAEGASPSPRRQNTVRGLAAPSAFYGGGVESWNTVRGRDSNDGQSWKATLHGGFENRAKVRKEDIFDRDDFAERDGTNKAGGGKGGKGGKGQACKTGKGGKGKGSYTFSTFKYRAGEIPEEAQEPEVPEDLESNEPEQNPEESEESEEAEEASVPAEVDESDLDLLPYCDDLNDDLNASNDDDELNASNDDDDPNAFDDDLDDGTIGDKLVAMMTNQTESSNPFDLDGDGNPESAGKVEGVYTVLDLFFGKKKDEMVGEGGNGGVQGATSQETNGNMDTKMPHSIFAALAATSAIAAAAILALLFLILRRRSGEESSVRLNSFSREGGGDAEAGEALVYVDGKNEDTLGSSNLEGQVFSNVHRCQSATCATCAVGKAQTVFVKVYEPIEKPSETGEQTTEEDEFEDEMDLAAADAYSTEREQLHEDVHSLSQGSRNTYPQKDTVNFS